MALVESLKLSLGTKMPAFELKDPYGKLFKGDRLYGTKGLLVVFTCNHCPYAVAVWPRLVRLASYAEGLGVPTVAINPNIHPDYPEDAPGEMKKKIKEWGIEFPYLVDETQEMARNFQAQCTPDIYLFDATQSLRYHGRFDDSWKDEKKVKRQELKEAIGCLIQNRPLAAQQFASMGCSIKWRD